MLSRLDVQVFIGGVQLCVARGMVGWEFVVEGY